MKIDIMNVLFTVSMILLAFTSAIIVTKSIVQFVEKKEKEKEKKD